MRPRLLGLVVVLLAHGSPADGQIIGIYADLASSHCSVVALLYVPANLYVNVVGTQGLNPSGMQGAEFRVEHGINASDAILSATANASANVTLGNPLASGCNIAFPTCQTGNTINLYTLEVIVLDAQTMTDQVLTIGSHGLPSNANFPCPLINKCDAPVFTAVCVQGGHGCINDVSGYCFWDPVELHTWSEVKALYN